VLEPGAPHARRPFRTHAVIGAIALAFASAALSVGNAAGVGAKDPAHSSVPTAAAIVAKNVAARGGLEAWRKVQTMVWMGRLESAKAEKPSMPFVLEQKRPNKTRFEVRMMNQRTLRVFDGTDGWKSRPGPGASLTLQPYAPEEIRFARSEQAVDGPLIDYEAHRSTVTLAGVDKLEGRKAYRLSVRLNSGDREFVWVDGDTFLDVKVSRVTFSADGQPRLVPVFYRKYQTFEGLKIPTSIEIGDPASGPTDRMEIEKVTLNAPMNDHLFTKPGRGNPAGPDAKAAPDRQAAGGAALVPPAAVSSPESVSETQ
jgi:hypothetical protein